MDELIKKIAELKLLRNSKIQAIEKLKIEPEVKPLLIDYEKRITELECVTLTTHVSLERIANSIERLVGIVG